MLWFTCVFLLTALTLYHFTKHRSNKSIPDGYQHVPDADGALPFIGHALQLRNILSFVRKCYQKYGKVFRINIFGVHLVVVCDKNLCSEFFKASEDQMSLYTVLDRLFFVDAFTDNPHIGSLNIRMVKSTVGVQFETFAPKILSEAKNFIGRMKEVQGKTIDLSQEAIRFVANTSARCFIGFPLSDEMFKYLMKFTHLQNSIVILTYFFPKWVLRKTINQLLRYYRKKLTSVLIPEIKKYREDPELKDSKLLRRAVDYFDEEFQRHLSDEEIGDIVVCLLYVSSENTALGLTATVAELAKDPYHWNAVREESEKLLNSPKELFASPLLDAVVMEAARLNTHIFPLNRMPIQKNTLGNYWIGGDTVALCEPIMMVHDSTNGTFKNPTEYDPARFLAPRNEPKAATDVMTWGAGVHICPGKMFALYEIKAAIALITTTFRRPQLTDGEINYFSPSAFAEKKVIGTFHTLQDLQKEETANCTILNYGNGILIKEFLSPKLQRDLWEYSVELAKGSSEEKEMACAKEDKAFPLAFYNLVYTGSSSCSEPKKWFDVANQLWKVSGIEHSCNFDSWYCQLFGGKSSMKRHKDEYVSWGVSISLGASCVFSFGEEELLLGSGDVLIADFSKVEHAVLSVQETTTPDWVREVNNYGRCRMSVQIRDTSQSIPPKHPLKVEEFKSLLSN